MALCDEEIGEIMSGFAFAALDPGRWKPAMQTLSDRLSAVGCALELTDLNTGATSMEISVELDADLKRDYEERIFHINPRVKTGLGMRLGQVASDVELTIPGDPNNSEFLDWLQKTPYYHILGGKILDQNGHVGFLTANYAKAGGPPPEQHQKVFGILTPHLINIVAAGRALSTNKLGNELITLGTFETERPFALLDRQGKLIECSIGFAGAIRRTGLLTLRQNQVIAVQPQHRKLVEAFLASALGSRRYLEPPLPIRLTDLQSPRGLILRAVSLMPGEDVFGIFKPAALLTLIDLDLPTRVRRQELIALFGLTEREADVAALLSEGNTIVRIVQALSISENTVRQHLKSVFGKLGISRQSELVAVVSRLG